MFFIICMGLNKENTETEPILSLFVTLVNVLALIFLAVVAA